MIVSVSSYLTIIAFEPHSIYSMRLAKRGQLLTHHKDKAVLTLMKMENVVEKDFVAVHPEMDLGELVKAIAASHRNMFPVTDKRPANCWELSCSTISATSCSGKNFITVLLLIN